MASVMQMNWPAVTPEQYDALWRAVDVEGDPPEGGISHVAWFDNVGLRVVDVWETPEQFDAYVESRLRPAASEAGITGAPVVEFGDVHHHFIPGR